MDISTILTGLGVPTQYAVYVSAVLGVCAVIAANIPPPANATSVWGRIYKVISFLGQNYKHAANAAPASAPAAKSAPPAAPTVGTTPTV